MLISKTASGQGQNHQSPLFCDASAGPCVQRRFEKCRPAAQNEAEHRLLAIVAVARSSTMVVRQARRSTSNKRHHAWLPGSQHPGLHLQCPRRAVRLQTRWFRSISMQKAQLYRCRDVCLTLLNDFVEETDIIA